MDGIRVRLDTAEEKIKELEYIAIKASLKKAQRERTELHGLWGLGLWGLQDRKWGESR